MGDNTDTTVPRAALASDDGYFNDEGSTGALACMVLDLCDDAADRLTKAAFIRLTKEEAAPFTVRC